MNVLGQISEIRGQKKSKKMEKNNKLREENDKLREENKHLRLQYDLMITKNESSYFTIKDLESQVERLKQSVIFLTGEFAEKGQQNHDLQNQKRKDSQEIYNLRYKLDRLNGVESDSF